MKINYKIKERKPLKKGQKVIAISKSTGLYGFDKCAYKLGRIKYYIIDDLDFSKDEHKHCIRCMVRRGEYELFNAHNLIPYEDKI